MPIPIPIAKALIVINANPGSKATAVSETSPIVAMTGPDASAKRSRFPDHPETVKVAALVVDVPIVRLPAETAVVPAVFVNVVGGVRVDEEPLLPARWRLPGR